MTREEADVWGARSLIRHDLTHATSPEHAHKIMREGFKPGQSGVWGAAIYAALDRETHLIYNRMSYRSNLTVRVNIRHPLFLHRDPGNHAIYDIGEAFRHRSLPLHVIDWLQAAAKERSLDLDRYGTVTELIGEAAKATGYDSLIYTEEKVDVGPGGNQVLVWDKRRITVIDVKHPEEKREGLYGSDIF